MAASSSRTVIYAALIGNLAVAATKLVASFWTGSSAMLSEAVHSLVDTTNEVLLLYGLHRASRRPDESHPLGYGREIYFWSFIVALLIFALGAGVSLYEGVLHILDPHPIEDAFVSYIVLGLSFLFEGTTWWIALKRFRAAKGDLGYFQAIRTSKDPPSFIVLFEDSAALLGILIALIATFTAVTFDLPVLDGAGSILIGLVLAATASLLARESKGLLIGERADRKLVDSILRIAGADPAVGRANGILTTQLGPDQVVAALSMEFSDDLRTPEIEERVVALERKIRETHPEVVALFVKPQSTGRFHDAYERRFGDGEAEE